MRIVVTRGISGWKTHILPIASGVLAEESQRPRATARPKALQLEILSIGMLEAVDARLECSRGSLASVYVILVELALGELGASLELAALATQSFGHGDLL